MSAKELTMRQSRRNLTNTQSVSRNSVAIRSEVFWVLARLWRRSMPAAACD